MYQNDMEKITAIFLNVVNLSITSIVVICIIMLLRLFLKKFPKTISYCLWAIVLLRLMCPYSITSAGSIFNYVNRETVVSNNSNSLVKMDYVNYGVNNRISDPSDKVTADSLTDSGNNQSSSSKSVTNIQNTDSDHQVKIDFFGVLSLAWGLGIVLLILLNSYWYFRIENRLKNSTFYIRRGKYSIYKSEMINTAFVKGFLNPKIYIPNHITKREEDYVIYHELVHIKRRDYLIMPVALLITAIHWFNPFVWIAFYLMKQDMEMSCDEIVMKSLGLNIKQDYSYTLLSMAAEDRYSIFSPFSTNGKGLKKRISNILGYKKPNNYFNLAGILLIVVLSIVLLTNPKVQNLQKITESDPTVPFSKEFGESLIEIDYWIADREVVVTDKNAINNIYSQFASLTLTKVSDNEPEKEGNFIINLVSSDKTMSLGLLSGELNIDGTRYYTDKDIVETTKNMALNFDSTERETNSDGYAIYHPDLANITITKADVNHDGTEERIAVDASVFDHGWQPVYINVYDSAGNAVYSYEATANNVEQCPSLLLCTIDGQDYLLTYFNYIWQGNGNYSYELFYLDKTNAKVTVASNGIEFYMPNTYVGANDKSLFPITEMASFYDEINSYLLNCITLVQMNNGELNYSTSASDGMTEEYDFLEDTYDIGYGKNDNIEEKLEKYYDYVSELFKEAN